MIEGTTAQPAHAPRAAPRSLKRAADVVAIVAAAPLVGLYRLVALVPRRRDAAFQACSQLVSLWPGVPGDFLRRAFYRMTLTAAAEDCAISFGTILATPEVEIGSGVYIGANCNVAHCRIGDDTLLGSNVMILSREPPAPLRSSRHPDPSPGGLLPHARDRPRRVDRQRRDRPRRRRRSGDRRGGRRGDQARRRADDRGRQPGARHRAPRFGAFSARPACIASTR